MRSLFQDLRYAARVLIKTPAFTLTAIFTLAIGIGANTAVFNLVDALLVAFLGISYAQRCSVVSTADSRLISFRTDPGGTGDHLQWLELLIRANSNLAQLIPRQFVAQ